VRTARTDGAASGLAPAGVLHLLPPPLTPVHEPLHQAFEARCVRSCERIRGDVLPAAVLSLSASRS
jgi:hypothetical protein